MSFIPPQSQTNFEAAKARAQELREDALRYAETHPKGDRPVGTGPQHVLRRLREVLRGKRASE